MNNGIFIKQEGLKAKIAIIGNISSWRNSANEFQEKLVGIKGNGITDVEIYINSFGGSVFEANEISNIILGFEGKIDFVLGAVCASAATIIIAQVIVQRPEVTVNQYRNGQFMIHNVSAEVDGEIKDIESALQLMRNLQKNAVDAYVAQTGIPEKEIIAMMDRETWMTANEALQKKFITGIINNTSTLPENFANISNCGYKNVPKIFEINNNKQIEEMTLEQINKATGKNFANESEALTYIANLEAENIRVNAERRQSEVAARNNEIETVLNKAISEKRILPGQKEVYRNLMQSSFEATKKLVEEMQPVQLISDQIKGNGTPPKSNIEGKTYRQLLETNPDALRQLHKDDIVQFKKLYKDEYGTEFIEN